LAIEYNHGKHVYAEGCEDEVRTIDEVEVQSLHLTGVGGGMHLGEGMISLDQLTTKIS
jgi:hypothetical protein